MANSHRPGLRVTQKSYYPAKRRAQSNRAVCSGHPEAEVRENVRDQHSLAGKCVPHFIPDGDFVIVEVKPHDVEPHAKLEEKDGWPLYGTHLDERIQGAV
jgi:hypothetical protein